MEEHKQQAANAGRGQPPAKIPERGYIVGIGASAGGIEALEEFFRALPSDSGACFVVVQHLSPHHESLLDSILDRKTLVNVRVAREGDPLKPNHALVIPPGRTLKIREGRLHLTPLPRQSPPQSIDSFFESMARELGIRAIGVVLSGTGSDGTRGARTLKESGGMVMVQNDSARFAGMPHSVISTGLADFIDTPTNLAAKLLKYIDYEAGESGLMNSEQRATLLDRLHSATGLNFSHFRAPKLLRSIEARIRASGGKTVDGYLEYLADHRTEAEILCRQLLDPETSFFRDPDCFELLRESLPSLLEDTPAGRPLRAWVPGCSTGQEAYAVAMLMHEAIEQQGSERSFKIFATDINEQVLPSAAQGWYGPEIAGQVSERRLNDYFEREGDGYVVRHWLRQRVVFTRHDVAKDPPFTRIDLLSCRNVLSSQQEISQERILAHLIFGLRAGGLLMLGAMETIGSLGALLQPVAPPHAVFRKLVSENKAKARRFPDPTPQPSPRPGTSGPLYLAQKRNLGLLKRITTQLLREEYRAGIVLSEDMRVEFVLGSPSGALNVPEGEPTTALFEMICLDAQLAVTDLRRQLDEAPERPAKLKGVTMREAPHAVVVDLTLAKLPADDEDAWLLLIADTDVVAKPADETSDHWNAATTDTVYRLEHELLQTRERLRVAVEELGASNEELSNANQELMASNEELQSTNEELHSVNEELQTVNEEYERRLVDQITLGQDIDNMLRASEIGTIFLDEQGCIRKFTHSVTSIIPLMEQDVGRPLAHLRNQIEGVDLVALSQRVQESAEIEEQVLKLGDDRWSLLRVLPYRGQGDIVTGSVITLSDITAARRMQVSLAESEERFRQLAENIRETLWIRTPDKRSVVYLSPSFEGTFGLSSEQVLDRAERWLDAVHEQDREKVARVLAEDSTEFDIEYRVIVPGDPEAERWVRDRAFPILDREGSLTRIGGLAEDITEHKRAERQLNDAAERLDELAHVDPLTELVNRRGLKRILERELAQAARTGSRPAALLIDCDDFKSVNDTMGHSTGDVVLREITKRLRKALRPVDTLARIGGDEFLALLPATREAEAVLIGERMRLAVGDAALYVDNRSLRVTASVGVTTIPEGVSTLEQIVARLHGGLSRGKKGGKNRVSTDAPDSESRLARDELMRSLANGSGLRVFAQGIHDLNRSTCIGYEFLSRGPEGPFENPLDFFRASAESRVMTPVDLACFKNCMHGTQFDPDKVYYHVNIMPTTLLEMTPGGIEELVDRTFGGRVCVELSEQQFIGEPAYLRSRVQLLKSLGMDVALDDVGFGRSSLESLIVLEPDVVKIDRSFVHGCDTDDHKRRSIERLIRLSRSLEVRVVAEGIESQGELRAIRNLGIEQGQGFYWDEPVEVELN